MPLYEYRCKKCDEVIEVIQKFSDPPLRRCRSCKGSLEKLISKSAFSLKGGGWYQQGYSAKSGGSPSEPKKKKKKDSGGDSSGGSSKADD